MILKRGYTDLALLVAPNLRWGRDDFEDFEEHLPEVFLGYTVRLLVPGRRGRARGFRVSKVVVTGEDAPLAARDQVRTFVTREIVPALVSAYRPRVQFWYVHRPHPLELLHEFLPYRE